MNHQAEWKILIESETRKKQKNVYTIDKYVNEQMKKLRNKRTSKQVSKINEHVMQ